MLLIPDIHINSIYKDKITDAIKSYISTYQDEKNIVFLGDYVYHFSYDRNALMMLYNLFLDLFYEGKSVYVLAGNHDWISDSFVFQEAQKAFDIINTSTNEDFGKIYFITEPKIFEIEGESVFMLPSVINSPTRVPPPGVQIPGSLHDHSLYQGGLNIQEQIKILNESQNKNEQMSAKINQILLDFIDKFFIENPVKNLMVIHHYYFNSTVFPGQKSRFSFKDIALSEEFLNLKNVKFISGHLHQGFVYKNYLCMGSVRSTSPLEVNQIKYFGKLNLDKVILEPININPYFVIDKIQVLQEGNQENPLTEKIDEEYIKKHYLEIQEKSKKNFESDLEIWDINFVEESHLNLKNVHLTVKVQEIDYGKIDEIIDQSLRTGLHDIQLKKDSLSLQDLLENFEISTKNLSTGFADWKVILKAYLQRKYQNEYGKYEKVLQELKLI